MSLLYWGQGHVHHVRHGDIQRAFRYPTLFLNFTVSEEEKLRELFRSVYHRVFSIRAEDYLDGRPGRLDDSARAFLKEKCGFDAEEIVLQTFPRMFGYVFNPVSFWFLRRDSALEAVLCEVRNTFGEKHFYWIETANHDAHSHWFTADKVFHVSPFLPVEGSYRFRFRLAEGSSRVDIHYMIGADELRLATWVEGKLTPLEAESVSALIRRYGWLTLLVIVRIHWQAGRLWLRKAKFFSKPTPPTEQVTR